MGAQFVLVLSQPKELGLLKTLSEEGQNSKILCVGRPHSNTVGSRSPKWLNVRRTSAQFTVRLQYHFPPIVWNHTTGDLWISLRTRL